MRASGLRARPRTLPLALLALALSSGCASNQKTADPTPVMASQADLARIRQAIAPCLRRAWVPPPATSAKYRAVRVTLRWRLDEDGRLVGDPDVLDPPATAGSSGGLFSGWWQTTSPAADAAIRAVRACQPYRLPVGEYHLWNEIVYTFEQG